MSIKILKISVCLLCSATGSLFAQNILFVGNSFTYKSKSPDASVVSDLNGGKMGGIPAIIHAMASESGVTGFEISMECVGGQTLSWHYAKKRELIDKPWDVVVLQDYSTRTLTTPTSGKGSNVPAFKKAVDDLCSMMRAKNPDAEMILYETWARPNMVKTGTFSNLEAMQSEIRTAYKQAAQDFNAAYAPVGDAFVAAVEAGYADDPSTEAKEGPHSLWAGDHYHQSNYGSFLSAAVFYARIFERDPRELSTGEDSVAAQLNLDPKIAQSLLNLAYQLTQS
ncbi:DUF4886 domain-containing protein [Coraliomargarita parva]|uniref:DUF4886 domain-containing protein n=1 Tax=Coraliomargarita parva TaxID=3014050 RepID=UPI0022B3D8BF|nr:DUF4886 domain-containing protein [Coraliomargarita parva]